MSKLKKGIIYTVKHGDILSKVCLSEAGIKEWEAILIFNKWLLDEGRYDPYKKYVLIKPYEKIYLPSNFELELLFESDNYC